MYSVLQMLVLPGYFLIIINIEGLTASTDADPGPQDPVWWQQ